MYNRVYQYFFFFSLGMPYLQGCQYFKDLFGPVLQSPQISVRDIQISSMDFFELTLKIKCWVQNPNSVSLEFSNLNYEISLGSSKIAKGTYEKKFKVGAEANAMIEIPLHISNFEALKILREHFKKREALSLLFKGFVDFHSSLGVLRIPFEHKRDLY